MKNKTPHFLSFCSLLSTIPYCNKIVKELLFGRIFFALKSSKTYNYNVVEKNIETGIRNNFIMSELELVKNTQCILIPVSKNIKYKISNRIAVTIKSVWCLINETLVALNSRKTIHVKAGLNSLFDAANNSQFSYHKISIKNWWNLKLTFKEQLFKLQNNSPLKEKEQIVLI